MSGYVPVTEGEFLQPKDGFMDRHLNDGLKKQHLLLVVSCFLNKNTIHNLAHLVNSIQLFECIISPFT